MSFTDFPTGFKELDVITNGMNKGELIILAARPSIGKTSFALNIAYNVANNKNRPVVFFLLIHVKAGLSKDFMHTKLI